MSLLTFMLLCLGWIAHAEKQTCSDVRTLFSKTCCVGQHIVTDDLVTTFKSPTCNELVDAPRASMEGVFGEDYDAGRQVQSHVRAMLYMIDVLHKERHTDPQCLFQDYAEEFGKRGPSAAFTHAVGFKRNMTTGHLTERGCEQIEELFRFSPNSGVPFDFEDWRVNVSTGGMVKYSSMYERVSTLQTHLMLRFPPPFAFSSDETLVDMMLQQFLSIMKYEPLTLLDRISTCDKPACVALKSLVAQPWFAKAYNNVMRRSESSTVDIDRLFRIVPYKGSFTSLAYYTDIAWTTDFNVNSPKRFANLASPERMQEFRREVTELLQDSQFDAQRSDLLRWKDHSSNECGGHSRSSLYTMLQNVNTGYDCATLADPAFFESAEGLIMDLFLGKTFSETLGNFPMRSPQVDGSRLMDPHIKVEDGEVRLGPQNLTYMHLIAQMGTETLVADQVFKMKLFEPFLSFSTLGNAVSITRDKSLSPMREGILGVFDRWDIDSTAALGPDQLRHGALGGFLDDSLGFGSIGFLWGRLMRQSYTTMLHFYTFSKRFGGGSFPRPQELAAYFDMSLHEQKESLQMCGDSISFSAHMWDEEVGEFYDQVLAFATRVHGNRTNEKMGTESEPHYGLLSPQGAPPDPDYPGGTCMGMAAMATVIRIFLKLETVQVRDIMYFMGYEKSNTYSWEADGPNSIRDSGIDSDMTVEDVLRSYMSNVCMGRVMVGHHSLQATTVSLRLGEAIGMKVVQEELIRQTEMWSAKERETIAVTFPTLEGDELTITLDGILDENGERVCSLPYHYDAAKCE